jgi:hypothetical protein
LADRDNRAVIWTTRAGREAARIDPRIKIRHAHGHPRLPIVAEFMRMTRTVAEEMRSATPCLAQ